MKIKGSEPNAKAANGPDRFLFIKLAFYTSLK